MTTLDPHPGAPLPSEPLWKRYVHGHHWRTQSEEFDGLKLGFWLFLATEVLLFGGIFCGYAIFRVLYPAAWAEGSHSLDWKIGCFNTAVLLISSYTMAVSIYCVQTNKIARARMNLLVTFLLGLMFVLIKLAFEYTPKWSGYFLIWDPALHHHESMIVHGKTAFFGLFQFVEGYGGKRPGILFNYPFAVEPQVPVWWAIYYCGTAIHALHVLIGMALIGRVWWLAGSGKYGPTYYTGVEIAGLYWHLVDLIWIFLFPLLYLIH